MANEFDFKEQAKALIKRLGQNPSASLNQGLALAAVETALREAYQRGQEDAKGRRAQGSAPSRAIQPTAGAPAQTVAAPECAHEWEEVFLDGRTLGNKCLDCGVLESEVQSRCDHYFVPVGAQEICVACRKPRRKNR